MREGSRHLDKFAAHLFIPKAVISGGFGAAWLEYQVSGSWEKPSGVAHGIADDPSGHLCAEGRDRLLLGAVQAQYSV